MTQEHPFAQYVRILGKGPHLSRPLTMEEAADATRMILKGEVEPAQLGAFLCLLRVKTEIPEEVAGIALGARECMDVPAVKPQVDLDWTSYAGKARQLPWFILSALLLAQNGVKVTMHGTEGHTPGRVYTRETLDALGIPVAQSVAQAASQVQTTNFTYIPLQFLSPGLHEIMGLRHLLGVRSPIHTVARHLNPFDAPCELISVAHPPYRPVHQGAAKLLGRTGMAVFKGEGGEVERRPEKPCSVFGLMDGETYEDEWPAIAGLTPHRTDESMDLLRLKRLWSGEQGDDYGTAIVTATAALALKAMGRVASHEAALAEAQAMWQRRNQSVMLGEAA